MTIQPMKDGKLCETTNQVQERIIAEMNALDSWMDKYQYLIEQGKVLEPANVDIRCEDNALIGCQSRVWIDAELEGGRVHYLADSDAQITRGIIALLLRVLNHRPPSTIVDTELYFIEQTGLARHLSPARGNGLAAVVAELRRRARKLY